LIHPLLGANMQNIPPIQTSSITYSHKVAPAPERAERPVIRGVSLGQGQMSNPTVSLGENFRESQEESDYGVAAKQMHNLQSSQSTDDKNKRKITTPLSGLQQTSHG